MRTEVVLGGPGWPEGLRMGDGAEVRAAFVAAYEPYVRARAEAKLAEAGGTAGFSEEEAALAGESLAAAIGQGRSWLAERLGELTSEPFAEQRRGPLELFQEAMKFPTGALAAAGVPPPERDEAVVNALPGDLYDLAPAASRDLGEEAWAAHLAWGAAKARALRPPMVGVLSGNLMDKSKLEGALRAAGMRTAPVGGGGELPDGLSALLADVEHPAAREAVERAAAAGVPCAAFGPHVNKEALAEAEQWGAQRSVPRSAAFRDPAGLIRRTLAGAASPDD